MNPTDPLAQLRDIHLPGDVSWWPLAPGWWVLIVLTMALLIWGGIKWYRWVQRQALLKEVKIELTRIQNEFDSSQTIRQLVTDSSQLIRRLLILHLGRDEGAHLAGQHWRDQLALYLSGNATDEDYLELLSNGQYQRSITLDDPEHFKQWINHCALAMSKQIITETSHA